MFNIHNPLKSKKKRRAKNLLENQAKLDAAQATGDLKKIQKYSGKVANSQAAAEAKLSKYRSAAESAEKYFGHGSVQHRAACAKLVRKAAKYGIPATALLAVMDFETGGTFDPAEPNRAGSGATGLIQFMPSTARALGTTTEALAQMSRAEQMQYVDRYFAQWGDRLVGGSVDDVYMAVLWPKAIGKSDDYVIFRSGTTAYDQNSGLDTNGDGTVTKYEAASKVRARYYGYG